MVLRIHSFKGLRPAYLSANHKEPRGFLLGLRDSRECGIIGWVLPPYSNSIIGLLLGF